MQRREINCIVPEGFRSTAHPIFFDYLPPSVEVEVVTDDSLCDNQPQTEEGDTQCEHEKTKSNESNFNADEEVVAKKRYLEDISCRVASSAQDNCSICLSRHENPITLVSCCHSFCRDCALVWFRKRRLCPLCKSTATYFVQTNLTYESVRANSSSDSACAKSRGVKVWAIYKSDRELQNFKAISSNDVNPSIIKHTERFLNNGNKSTSNTEINNSDVDSIRVVKRSRVDHCDDTPDTLSL